MIALIPARAGSVRFPKKNHATLDANDQISLTLWSLIQACCVSRAFHTIVVSSDDPRVLETADQFKAWLYNSSHSLAELADEILIRERPPEVSGDVSIMKVIEDARATCGDYVDVQDMDVLLMQPTSVFRTMKTFREVTALARTTKVHTVGAVKVVRPLARGVAVWPDAVHQPVYEPTALLTGTLYRFNYHDNPVPTVNRYVNINHELEALDIDYPDQYDVAREMWQLLWKRALQSSSPFIGFRPEDLELTRSFMNR